ncbi:MAG: hypothetical protein EA362_12475 [Saprospirales bacterium]|nr:MAG: hypothetical protein EA362_12475 [Saprospirales bacterium]
MSTLNAQVPIDWHPSSATISKEINSNILSKPFCSTPENAISIVNYYLQFKGEDVKDTVVPFIKVQE